MTLLGTEDKRRFDRNHHPKNQRLIEDSLAYEARKAKPPDVNDLLRQQGSAGVREMFDQAQRKPPPETPPPPPPAGDDKDDRQKQNRKAEPPSDGWPSLDTEAAHIGVVWDVVEAIGPETEADHFAILLLFLVAVGNAIGRGPFYLIEGTRHYTNLFGLLIGPSAIGRKGTAQGRVDQIMDIAENVWTSTRREKGLSSGEGLIWAVRDPVQKMVKGVEEEVDGGVSDKRLYVVEEEFASTLAVMKREGNTLSPVTRSAWDGGRLGMLTKNSINKCTEPLISIVGHITIDELRRELDRSSMGNGFANRFLFACVRRSRLLPHGGNLSDLEIEELGDKTAKAIDYAKTVQRVVMEDGAKKFWAEIYSDLSAERTGLLGSITARGAPQTIRLAMIYALLDGKDRIDVIHLKAGLAVWRYCDASVQFVFSDALGDPVADEIMRALRNAGEIGMTRTEIRDHFGRHKGVDQIGAALSVLATRGMAVRGSRVTGGRSPEVWTATATEAT